MHEVVTEPDVIEGLDFEYIPVCETGTAGWGVKVFGRVFSWGDQACDRPAVWAGRCRYCGDTGYTCDPHQRQATGTWYCPRCHRALGNGRDNGVIWTRL